MLSRIVVAAYIAVLVGIALALAGCLIVIPFAALGLAKVAHTEYCAAEANHCGEEDGPTNR